MSQGLFITGTSTSVGKTWITASLTRILRENGVDAVAIKPFCCGPREDAELLREASGSVLSIEKTNPVWFRAPAAPYVAAMVEGRHIDIDFVLESIEAVRRNHQLTLVEGAGGWRVPISKDFAISHLAARIGVPVAVVASNRLGALNHTLLTLESIQESRVPLLGTLLNDLAPIVPRSRQEMSHESDGTHDDHLASLTNPAILEELLGCPLLDHVTWNGYPDRLAGSLIQQLRDPSSRQTNEPLTPKV